MKAQNSTVCLISENFVPNVLKVCLFEKAVQSTCESYNVVVRWLSSSSKWQPSCVEMTSVVGNKLVMQTIATVGSSILTGWYFKIILYTQPITQSLNKREKRVK